MQLRKVIHIGGVLVPVFAALIGKKETIILLLLILASFFIIEALKSKIPRDILAIFYRESELNTFSIEPLSYFISIISLLYLSFFLDEKICFASIAILAAGDGFAGVIGRKYGNHRLYFNKNKSWEGSISGFMAASLSGYYYAGWIALIGSASGMVAGALNKHDNIAVRYAALVAMMIFSLASLWI